MDIMRYAKPWCTSERTRYITIFPSVDYIQHFFFFFGAYKTRHDAKKLSLFYTDGLSYALFMATDTYLVRFRAVF